MFVFSFGDFNVDQIPGPAGDFNSRTRVLCVYYRHASFQTILTDSSGVQIISGLVQGFAALNDIIITVALCYFLNVHRSAAIASCVLRDASQMMSDTEYTPRRTGQLIDSLILYAVSRGT